VTTSRQRPDRSGKELERLVATLERVLADTGAKIEAPSRALIDRDTGKRREHDVLIRWDHGHHQIVTAIECRDRSRPVGVPEVEAFADKCERTGVHSGVIVSARGFTSSAHLKAKARSITCMDLAAVESFDWMGTEVIVGYERRVTSVNAVVRFNGEHPDNLAALFDSEGTEVSNAAFTQTVVNKIPPSEDPDSEVDHERTVRLHLNTLNWRAADSEGRSWPIDHIVAVVCFTTVKTVHPIKVHAYSGGGKHYEVATAEAKFGDHSGQFVLMKGEDGYVIASWSPDLAGPK
jgi:hypothetical protein